MAVRLQKFLADAGLASRRGGEDLIRAGRVEVNGQTVTELGTRVDPAHDKVRVDGSLVRALRKHYLALNKPRGYLCARSDAGGKKLVTELLPAEWAHVYPVGRLDRDSEGLLFLTNDGDFCLRVTHPRYGLRKKYLATVPGQIEASVVHRLTKGVNDQGEFLKAERAKIVSATPDRTVVELELSEGRNREVRRLFEAQGLEVERLTRVQIGPIKLGELKVGRWRVLTPPEIKALLAGGQTMPGTSPGRRPVPAPTKMEAP